MLKVSDWTAANGERSLSFIPMRTFGQKLAQVDGYKGDEYTRYGKLQTLDRRVKTPFAWYSYMCCTAIACTMDPAKESSRRQSRA